MMKYDFKEQDFHCMSRLLQGITFYGDIFATCKYCNYFYECCKANTLSNYTNIRTKLQEKTGVYISALRVENLEAYASWQLLSPEKIDLIINLSLFESKEKEREYQKMKEEIKNIQEQKNIYQQFLTRKS